MFLPGGPEIWRVKKSDVKYSVCNLEMVVVQLDERIRSSLQSTPLLTIQA